MNNQPINIQEKLTKFHTFWSPKVVAEMNNYQLKVAKFSGEFVWHKHDHTDEVFLVVKGELTIRMRDEDVVLKNGDLFVVPQGVEHCPYAKEECHVILIEPKGVINTGEVKSSLTAENDVWI
ncbi:cupin domain-containing protein [Cytobacillus kochii]